jgi:hypothetical protein
MPQSGSMDRSRHQLTAHLKSVLDKEAYLPWIFNQSHLTVGPRRDFVSIFFQFPLDFILVLCRRERSVFLLIRTFAVPGKLRFPRVLRSGLLFKLRLIAAPSFAHLKTTILFQYLGAIRHRGGTIELEDSSDFHPNLEGPSTYVVKPSFKSKVGLAW